MVQLTTSVTKVRQAFILKRKPESRFVFFGDKAASLQGFCGIHLDLNAEVFGDDSRAGGCIDLKKMANIITYLFCVVRVHTVGWEVMHLDLECAVVEVYFREGEVGWPML